MLGKLGNRPVKRQEVKRKVQDTSRIQRDGRYIKCNIIQCIWCTCALFGAHREKQEVHAYLVILAEEQAVLCKVVRGTRPHVHLDFAHIAVQERDAVVRTP